MLSDDEILGLWAEGRQQAPARPVLGSRKVVAFARAVERAAYERAAQECERAGEAEGPPYGSLALACADDIRALKEQR